jgi:hypothetical protein
MLFLDCLAHKTKAVGCSETPATNTETQRNIPEDLTEAAKLRVLRTSYLFDSQIWSLVKTLFFRVHVPHRVYGLHAFVLKGLGVGSVGKLPLGKPRMRLQHSLLKSPRLAYVPTLLALRNSKFYPVFLFSFGMIHRRKNDYFPIQH